MQSVYHAAAPKKKVVNTQGITHEVSGGEIPEGGDSAVYKNDGDIVIVAISLKETPKGYYNHCIRA